MVFALSPPLSCHRVLSFDDLAKLVLGSSGHGRSNHAGKDSRRLVTNAPVKHFAIVSARILI